MATRTTIDDQPTPTAGATTRRREGLDPGPVMIEARGVSKSFRIPEQRMDTVRERVTHPLTRPKFRELRALNDVSFDVHRGEFFGIVGRNGSGKSTLLKILASIYRPGAGRIRMAGRMAPFIELGVGFNPEMTARENVVLNGVLFGLSRRDARSRLDAVLDFAELREFTDLKVKNYSSGMMVRLAFSIMVQADADIMLIDEVLAVGDAAFAQKCMDVFYERRRIGKTIVLVTHDMATVQSLCHRALVLHDGELIYVGDPEDAALRYYRLNFAHEVADDGEAVKAPFDEDVEVEINARMVQAKLLNPAGKSVLNVEEGQPIVVELVIEAARELVEPNLVIRVVNDEHVLIFGCSQVVEQRVSAGQRIRVAAEIENRLVPGRYAIDCWIGRQWEGGARRVQGMRVIQFTVFGTGSSDGLISLSSKLRAEVEPEGAS